jgi:excisionase family DNA binding protein
MPPDIPEAEPLLTPAEVATMFRVDPKTVTRWAKAGRLTSIRTLGGHRRYRETEVRALLAGAPEKSADPLAAPVHTLWPTAVTGPAATARDRLQAAGVRTVGEVTTFRKDGLEDLGLKPPQIEEVRVALFRKGLALKGEVLGEVA